MMDPSFRRSHVCGWDLVERSRALRSTPDLARTVCSFFRTSIILHTVRPFATIPPALRSIYTTSIPGIPLLPPISCSSLTRAIDGDSWSLAPRFTLMASIQPLDLHLHIQHLLLQFLHLQLQSHTLSVSLFGAHLWRGRRCSVSGAIGVGYWVGSRKVWVNI